jgi:ABC-type transport system substrate-binding protein
MRGPDGRDIPWLAESITAETHADNPTVTEGYTRFRIKTVDNATWTDGTPLTAQDVAFSFNYYRDASGHPNGPALSELRACYAMTNTDLIMEFESESYWHMQTITSLPIIPKHIFVEIGLDGWHSWNPQPPFEPMVTSGPFNVSAYFAPEILQLSSNPTYFRRPSEWPSSPWAGPSISSPEDITVPSAQEGREVTWAVANGIGANYSIYVNSSQVAEGIIDSDFQNLTISLNESEPGNYNCTLCIMTSFGYNCSDTVWVRVEEEPLVGSTEWDGFLNPVSLAITAVCLGVIIVVGGKLMREMGI